MILINQERRADTLFSFVLGESSGCSSFSRIKVTVDFIDADELLFRRLTQWSKK